MTAYKSFSKVDNDATREPMFLGNGVNISRYDQQKYPIFEHLCDKQLSFFWRPEEVDVSKDRIDFSGLPEHEKHIFTSNLKYQILLDSVQGRSPNMAFLPVVSLPEVETWVELWSAYETIHSRSYTHIIRNIVTDPGAIFDDIMKNEHILERAGAISKYYDALFEMNSKYMQGVKVDEAEHRRRIYLCVASVNVLEAIRFYVSFACSFAFGESRKMEGNAKIIKLIARDEALHMVSTQHILNILSQEWPETEEACRDEMVEIFRDAAEQEKRWAEYLFKDGSMIGLNVAILSQYVEYLTNNRMASVGLEPIYQPRQNPIPWINNWLNSDNVQVAPQETEITSYLTGQVDSTVDADDLGGFEL